MKTYEEMAQSALVRGKAIRKQRKKTNAILFGTLSALAVCCLVIMLSLGIGENGPILGPTDGPGHHGAMLPSINLRSLAQLDEMREMISCTDEEKLNRYLMGLEGGGAKSRTDLISFVNLIESLPILEFLEGDIVLICHKNITTDGGNDVVVISTQGINGNWTRVEYLVYAKDVNAEIELMEMNGYFDNSTIEVPMQSDDGRIVVYSEVKETHTSGNGGTITWTIVVDGILVRVVYYSKEISDINAESIFSDLAISTLKNEKHSE